MGHQGRVAQSFDEAPELIHQKYVEADDKFQAAMKKAGAQQGTDTRPGNERSRTIAPPVEKIVRSSSGW